MITAFCYTSPSDIWFECFSSVEGFGLEAEARMTTWHIMIPSDIEPDGGYSQDISEGNLPPDGASVVHFLSLHITTVVSNTTNTANLYTCKPTRRPLSQMTLTLKR